MDYGVNNQNKDNDPYSDNPLIELRQLKSVRKVTARRLTESYKDKVHVTAHRAIECDTLLEFIKIKKNGTISDYLFRATAIALDNNSIFNATFDGEEFRIYKKICIGVAVDTPRGLVVPVLKDCLELNFDDFVKRRRELINAALNSQYTLEDLFGGTFTVSNLGVMGVDNFNMIINPPQVAILGVGRLYYANISWSKDEEPKVRALLPLSLTHDHRVLDGADAARFLNAIQELFLEPIKIMEY